MDLATAVATAQTTAGGIAVEGEVDSERDSIVYSVKLAKGNAVPRLLQ